jgi:sulfite reductase alpha subunit-like flavoprotein
MLPLFVAALTLAMLAIATLLVVLEDGTLDPAPAVAAEPPFLSAKAASASTGPVAQQHVVVFFGTLKGGSERLAERLARALRDAGASAETRSLVGYDTDGLASLPCAAFVLATYEGGVAPPGCEAAVTAVAEAACDFRGSDLDLHGLRYALFGCGNSEYPRRDFNAAGKRLDRSLRRLGGTRVARGGWGDGLDNRMEEQFDEWMLKAVPALAAQPRPARTQPAAALSTPAATGAAAAAASHAAALSGDAEGEEESASEDGLSDAGEGLVDVEDIGLKMVKRADAGGAEKENGGGSPKQVGCVYCGLNSGGVGANFGWVVG